MKNHLERGFELLSKPNGIDSLESLREECSRVTRLRNGLPGANLRNLFDHSERFLNLAGNLQPLCGGKTCVRGILFDKTEQNNWPVAWHQDLTIAVTDRKEIGGYGPWSIKDGVPHVQPPQDVLESMTTIRLHLDPTPSSNGALRVIPGSNRKGILNSAEIQQLSRTQTPTVCECDAGDILMMSPLLLHASYRSENPAHRRVLHFEYADLETLSSDLEWAFR